MNIDVLVQVARPQSERASDHDEMLSTILANPEMSIDAVESGSLPEWTLDHLQDYI